MKIYEIISEAIGRDELVARMSRKQKQRMLDAIFTYLDKAVRADPSTDVRKHAFQVGREIDLSGVGLDSRSLSKMYSDKTGIPESRTNEDDEIEEVEIDNVNGLGSVPYNQDVDYRGMRVAMRPSKFLALAAPMSNPRSVDHLKQHISGGGAIGAPFLMVEVNEDNPEGSPPRIVGHEGRNRMIAVQDVEGDNPVEVHLLFRGRANRARHLTSEIKQNIVQAAYQEETGALVRGPLWKEM